MRARKKKRDKRAFQLFLAQNNHLNYNNSKLAYLDKAIPKENIGRALDDRIAERLQLNIDINKIYATVKKTVFQSAFQPEVRDKLELSHIAVSRNPFDLGVVFQKGSKLYERFYKKIIKKVSRP